MHPFTSRKCDSVAALGEERLIAHIRSWLGPVSPPSPAGIGDDCAVLPVSSRRRLITVDPVIYGRHFDDSITPSAVGAKLLKRNLSDLAAMGGKPSAAVIALGLDPGVKISWLEGFYRGLAREARRHGLPVVGGDVAQADGFLGAFLTLLGEPAGHRILARTGARLGDYIYVTGRLGGSLLGHHLTFTPRLTEGAWLARQPEVKAMMDVSDGLAKDLPALTPTGTRAALDATAIPISAAARRLSRQDKMPALVHALGDGEDYELVLAVSARADFAAFEARWRKAFATPLTCIGRFVQQNSFPDGAIDPAAFSGYEHLR